MNRIWLLLLVVAVGACSARTPPIVPAQQSAVPTETKAPESANTAEVESAGAPSVAPDPPDEDGRLAFPESQAELDALSFAERLSLARAALNDLAAGRTSRGAAFAPALSLVRSIPGEVPEATEARALARSLESFRPPLDEIIESVPPEERLEAAILFVKQVLKDPTRTDLIEVAQSFIDAIPDDLVVDQERLVAAKNAILIARVEAGLDSPRDDLAEPGLGDAVPRIPIGVPPVFPSDAQAPCDGCRPKSVRVRGYTRKDGTRVRAHTRSAPR